MQENNYLPLFRKYRPQSFKDVIGQEFTVKALCNAIELNKIANAYLFCGPRGTGKTSLARIFAKSLNCEKGPTVEPCQKCRSCLDVTNASGIDVIEIDAATNRGIDDAKELISKVQYAPMSGKYKIFIIDEVHMLSKEAFNALLKTFEEPPKNVIFILATTEPHKVIETIVSRCQRFDFKRITTDDIVKRLEDIAKLENINITKEALFSIAKNVSGGMRDSLALLDQSSVLGLQKEITKEDIEALIGKLTFDTLYELLCTIIDNDIQKAIQKVNNIYLKGSEPRNFIENFIEFLRNITLILNSKDDTTSYSLTLIELENIKKVKENKNLNSEKIISILDSTIEFYKEIKSSTNPYLWAELCIISITAKRENTVVQKSIVETVKKEVLTENKTNSNNIPFIEPVQNNEPKENTEIKTAQKEQEKLKEDTENEPKIKTEEIEQKQEIKITPSAAVEAAAEIVSNSTSSSDASSAQIWVEILNKIDSIPAKFFFKGLGKLIGIKNNTLTLGFVSQNAITQAKSDNKYNPLIKALKLVLGEGAAAEFITVSDDTKIIETNLSSKISVPKDTYNTHETAEKKETNYNSNKMTSEFKQPKKEIEKPIYDKDNEDEIVNYTRAAREMLDTFGGRLIE